uniref:Uncharacterized protein n=1 Tax=Siphoviridae sp. ctfWC31 TaxID=2826414 RepID=A0A8S5N7B7_9CAUD|nr:MAG TPA: hypothetical protein [Siphoviridae sp. ctfWC31]
MFYCFQVNRLVGCVISLTRCKDNILFYITKTFQYFFCEFLYFLLKRVN